MRLLALLVTGVLLAACGGSSSERSAPRTPAPSTDAPTDAPVPSLPGGRAGPTRPGPSVVPHRDQGVTRSGPVALRAPCERGVPGFAFDGTVTGIDGGQVTFEVHETFGETDLPATTVVTLGAPVSPGPSETSPSYSVGTRLLVSGDDGTAWGCGATRYYDEATAAEWRS